MRMSIIILSEKVREIIFETDFSGFGGGLFFQLTKMIVGRLVDSVWEISVINYWFSSFHIPCPILVISSARLSDFVGDFVVTNVFK